MISNYPKHFDWILSPCSEPQKQVFLSIHDRFVELIGENGFGSSTGKIEYGKPKSKKFACIRREKGWLQPKLFLKLPIPYKKRYPKQLQDKKGWMGLEIEESENIKTIYYYPTKKDGYPRINNPERQILFNDLFLEEERIKYTQQNKTQLEMAIDKALRVAGLIE